MKSLPISYSNKSANEEWPEIINMRKDNPLSNDMIRVEYHEAWEDDEHEVKTKTIDDEPKKQIDIKDISANDLE